MLVLDFALLAVGVAGMTFASVLHVRRFPNTAVGRWRGQDGQSSTFELVLGLVSVVVAVLGGANAQERLGWWVYVLAFALFVASGAIPRWMHNRVIR